LEDWKMTAREIMLLELLLVNPAEHLFDGRSLSVLLRIFVQGNEKKRDRRHASKIHL